MQGCRQKIYEKTQNVMVNKLHKWFICVSLQLFHIVRPTYIQNAINISQPPKEVGAITRTDLTLLKTKTNKRQHRFFRYSSSPNTLEH